MSNFATVRAPILIAADDVVLNRELSDYIEVSEELGWPVPEGATIMTGVRYTTAGAAGHPVVIIKSPDSSKALHVIAVPAELYD